MTTLYIRHPARADGAGAQCHFALVAASGGVLQQGSGAFGSLKDLVAGARRVVLMLAACDVTLLNVKMPPLSSARLKAALPGLVEDQLLGDPADCVLVAAPAAGPDDMRAVAVVQRAWLEPLVKQLFAQGARSVSALPSQLCLPVQPGGVAAAIDHADLVLRRSQYDGMGLALAAEPTAVLHTVLALAGEAPLTLYVPPSDYEAYAAAASGLPVAVEADQWPRWIEGAGSALLDLAPGLGNKAAQARSWQRWRWPLRLALLAVLVNIAAVNVQWLRLKREADAVRQAMLQTFKAALPHETVILDPLAQMRQRVAAARVASGQVGADEFVTLSAAFGEALRALPRKPDIAGLDYRERSLTVKLKAGSADPALTDQLRAALGARKLALREPAANTWQIQLAGVKQ